MSLTKAADSAAFFLAASLGSLRKCSRFVKILNQFQWTQIMQRVTGIGGVFFKARDPKALSEWYAKHLGFDIHPWGGATFSWKSETNPQGMGATSWTPFASDTDYFAPSTTGLMVNYRVADLHALLAALCEEGCHVLDKVDDSEYGKFGWVIDPEGNKVELWQPPAGQ